MGWNLTVPCVGFHIKLHGNTQILTEGLAVVVLMRRLLTIALTSSANLKPYHTALGFCDLKLL